MDATAKYHDGLGYNIVEGSSKETIDRGQSSSIENKNRLWWNNSIFPTLTKKEPVYHVLQNTPRIL